MHRRFIARTHKTLSFIAVFVLLASLLVSCGGSLPENRGSGVVREDVLDYGPFLFFPYRILFRYNRSTNTVTRMCSDPECGGNCPLDALADYPHFVDGSRLYFTAVDFGFHILHAYTDILTGDVTVLRELTQAEAPFDSYMLSCDGEYVWYQAKLLKEGGSKTDSKDYETWLCRMPKSGGREERVFTSDSLCLRAATPYGIVMSDELGVYLLDTSTREAEMIYDLAAQGYVGWHSTPQYYDGKLYFCASHSAEGKSEPYLMRLDVQNKDVKKLVADPVEEFALTVSGIYYLLTPEGTQIIGNGGDTGAYPSVLAEKQELRYCDLNGENDEAIVTNSRTLLSGFTVADGILYGFIIQWNQETQSWNSPFFGTEDLKTGRIAKAEGSTAHEIPQKQTRG